MVRRDGRHETVHGELLAHAIPIARCRVSGPDTRICGEAPLPLALALHELAVNAIVHGAFLGTHGSLEVTWSYVEREGRQWLRLVWQESGQPARLNPPATKGFGLELRRKAGRMSATAAWIERLSRHASLAPADVSLLEQSASAPSLFAAQEGLSKTGSRVDGAFVLLDGLACEFKLLADGRRQILAYLFAGDMSDARLPLTQAEIGDTLALSAVHVNRTLMEMRRLGLVTFQNRQASIHDFPLTPA